MSTVIAIEKNSCTTITYLCKTIRDVILQVFILPNKSRTLLVPGQHQLWEYKDGTSDLLKEKK